MIRSPHECATMDHIRREIDRLDRELIYTLRLRGEYVAAAAEHKRTDQEARSPERVAQVLATRREWAEHDGVSPALVERLYRTIVEHHVEQERTRLAARLSAAVPEPV